MTPQTVIREFDFARDYDAALKLWGEMEKGVNVGPSDTPAEIQKKLERDPDLFLVAESDGCVIGTVIGGYDGRRGLIYHLAVKREFRANGLGSQLMTEVENRLRAKGCLKCYLIVLADNEDAMRFYERLGWYDMSKEDRLFGKVLQ
ncbi:MAG: GNAT family acetyltransferase [Chloroflexota bacterium]